MSSSAHPTVQKTSKALVALNTTIVYHSRSDDTQSNHRLRLKILSNTVIIFITTIIHPSITNLVLSHLFGKDMLQSKLKPRSHTVVALEVDSG